MYNQFCTGRLSLHAAGGVNAEFSSKHGARCGVIQGVKVAFSDKNIAFQINVGQDYL